MASPRIFITYNPDHRIEEATALRLQTIASLYGLEVELPDRIGVGAERNTEERISRADYVVAFILRNPLRKAKEEINKAIELKKTLILIYDRSVKRPLSIANYPNLFESTIDFSQGNAEDALHKVSEFIRDRHPATKKNTLKLSEGEKSLLALLGIGLGIAGLAALIEKK